MLNCKQTSYLASKKLDETLSWKERMNFSLHIAMCRLCRHYATDIKKLQTLIQKTDKSNIALLPASTKLSKQSRAHIKQVLDNALHQMHKN
jgi:predicted anti-sigma-YlaC factor YlaD